MNDWMPARAKWESADTRTFVEHTDGRQTICCYVTIGPLQALKVSKTVWIWQVFAFPEYS